MADKIKICALGGLDEKGRDLYVVEINDDIFVLDAGCSVPDKNIPGVDYLLPNIDYLIENKDRLRAYIITHGHDENMSGLKYFYDFAPAPVYCTRATKYCIDGQAKIHGIDKYFEFHDIKGSSTEIIAGREFHFFTVSHNAANSVGVAIETNRGLIVYTSDFIVDYSLKNPEYVFDFKFLSTLANKETLIVLAESKKAGTPGYCSPKHKITSHVEKYFKEANKRIFINSFWQNFFRISEIVSLCKTYHKKLYFYNEYTKKIMDIFFKFSTIQLRPDEVVSSENLLRVKNSDVVVLMLGHGEELYEEMKLIATGENTDKRLSLTPDDVFINVALPLPALETLATRSIDMIYRSGCEVVWVNKKQVVSMHACQDDLKFFLSVLKPKFYMPVRGSFVNLMDNARLAMSMGIGLNYFNIFILDNGMQLVFDGPQDKPQIIPNEVNNINIAPVLVDGRGITKIADSVIEDRIKLSNDGVVIVAATVSPTTKTIVAGPDCQMRGFVYVKEAEPLLKSISNIFIDEINTALLAGETDFTRAVGSIQERSRRFIKRENGREPLIFPIIIPIE